jgi:hypothetical protein
MTRQHTLQLVVESMVIARPKKPTNARQTALQPSAILSENVEELLGKETP